MTYTYVHVLEIIIKRRKRFCRQQREKERERETAERMEEMHCTSRRKWNRRDETHSFSLLFPFSLSLSLWMVEQVDRFEYKRQFLRHLNLALPLIFSFSMIHRKFVHSLIYFYVIRHHHRDNSLYAPSIVLLLQSSSNIRFLI